VDAPKINNGEYLNKPETFKRTHRTDIGRGESSQNSGILTGSNFRLCRSDRRRRLVFDLHTAAIAEDMLAVIEAGKRRRPLAGRSGAQEDELRPSTVIAVAEQHFCQHEPSRKSKPSLLFAERSLSLRAGSPRPRESRNVVFTGRQHGCAFALSSAAWMHAVFSPATGVSRSATDGVSRRPHDTPAQEKST
jgi:hypothetical protein